MSTSERVLYILESNKDIYTSGEDMARQCSVSRNAVWKAIKDLREKGYNIEAVSNKGYRLTDNNDIISVGGIKAELPTDFDKADIYVYDSLKSTSDKAKELAMTGAAHGTVIIATTQTGGRGRKDHTFFSPEGGLYMSIILRPESLFSTDSKEVTTFVGEAVIEAIKELSGIEAHIGGINDLYVDDKKICGILLESGSEFDSNTLQWIVAGIGINFDSDISEFPEDVRERATSLFDAGKATITKNALIARVIEKVLDCRA
ncbi:MAG: biotin--[acetyl-CoA-carboxylase] ligase [Butyrivibrio sp.]|uniref:biotin--[acetyl-CoA-carboxylase] ligase n=1 Tax=Butyrivibrio sp. TaxID=28121 RepID=UPI001B2272F3|nr:biotin--[acetyl-CoA-carboxylase] ligase [Butyrivibrio sp.]MBO6241816.1 biotin--[acetyl-CoA-carboxylase] ligase [Butyrivibrio sp.]